MAVNSIEFIIERLQLPLNYGLSIDTWRISYISKLKGNHFVLFSFINCAIILIFRWDIGKSFSLVWRGKVSLWHYVYGKHIIFSLNALKWREMLVSLLSNQSGNFFPNCLGKWSEYKVSWAATKQTYFNGIKRRRVNSSQISHHRTPQKLELFHLFVGLSGYGYPPSVIYSFVLKRPKWKKFKYLIL